MIYQVTTAILALFSCAYASNDRSGLGGSSSLFKKQFIQEAVRSRYTREVSNGFDFYQVNPPNLDRFRYQVNDEEVNDTNGNEESDQYEDMNPIFLHFDENGYVREEEVEIIPNRLLYNIIANDSVTGNKKIPDEINLKGEQTTARIQHPGTQGGYDEDSEVEILPIGFQSNIKTNDSGTGNKKTTVEINLEVEQTTARIQDPWTQVGYGGNSEVEVLPIRFEPNIRANDSGTGNKKIPADLNPKVGETAARIQDPWTTGGYGGGHARGALNSREQVLPITILLILLTLYY